MCIPLLDVNVLVALHDPKHMFHERAHDWFEGLNGAKWATCPFTENGFVRVLTQSKYPNNIAGVSVVISMLTSFKLKHKLTHEFWSDPLSLSDDKIFNAVYIAGPKQITDVYLVALCKKNEGTFATFDTRVNLQAIFGAHPGLLTQL